MENTNYIKFIDKQNDEKLVLIPVEESWKNKGRMWGDKMHRICSYVAMFSPALVEFFINKYASEIEDIVLDTFSGRGTTLLQARLMGKKGYAVDLNPFAYVLSRSKSQSFFLEHVLERINLWENKFIKLKNNIDITEDKKIGLDIYYSDINLQQLKFIQIFYGSKWESLDELDNFVLALVLGIMHGPARKNGDSIYLSLSMSNHTSMSKNYVLQYSKKHNLKKPEDNIFDKIRERASKIISKSEYSENKALVKYGNALNIFELFGDIKPKLIFTSPPYLNIINYTRQNWIKMWLLGFTNTNQNKMLNLDDKHNLKDYKKFMIEYLINISNFSTKDTKIALVIGDVQKYEQFFSFENMWDDIKSFIPQLVLMEIYIDNINQKKKATNSMGTRAGKATRVDKIYIFKKK